MTQGISKFFVVLHYVMCRDLYSANSLALGVGSSITKVPLMVVESQIVVQMSVYLHRLAKAFLTPSCHRSLRRANYGSAFKYSRVTEHPGTGISPVDVHCHQWCCTISISRKAWLLSGAFLKWCVGKKIIIEDIKKICDSFTLLIGFMYKNG